MHTTICLHPATASYIDAMARKKQRTRNDLICSILSNEVRLFSGTLSSGSCVQYQPSCREGLVLVHIFLDPVLYEACLDLRKLCKKSVSYILSLAIEKMRKGEVIKCDIYQIYYAFQAQYI